MSRRDVISSLAVLIFFIFFYVCAGSLDESIAYWPKLICVAGGIFSILNIGGAIIKMLKETSKQSIFPLESGQIKRSLSLMIIVVTWIFIIPYLGFLSTSILATGAMVLIFEPDRCRKNIIRDIVATVIFSIVLYLLFQILGVHFEDGFLK